VSDFSTGREAEKISGGNVSSWDIFAILILLKGDFKEGGTKSLLAPEVKAQVAALQTHFVQAIPGDPCVSQSPHLLDHAQIEPLLQTFRELDTARLPVLNSVKITDAVVSLFYPGRVSSPRKFSLWALARS
jgi:hypothetical protein